MQAPYKHEDSTKMSLWAASRSLTFTGLIMIVDFAACFIAMAFDSQQITGVNAWLKPLKFGLSSAITCLTLAWIAGYLTQWPKVRKWASRVCVDRDRDRYHRHAGRTWNHKSLQCFNPI